MLKISFSALLLLVASIGVLLANINAPALLQTARPGFSRMRARPSPDWLRDGVIYEIFPRTFSAQGNFNGITSRLDELKELGVNILWLMPIHPVGQARKKGSYGSPYAVRDYYGINPDYGTKADLARLVSAAHARGMKVIIDIVANHTSWDSVMMKSPEFYKHDRAGKIIPPVAEWTDVAALDYSNPRLRQYMTDMLVSWIRDFDLDGFRCDVAGMVPTDFWEAAQDALEKTKPDIMMLAEWHDPALLVKAFDIDYSWPLHRNLTDTIQGILPATSLREAWEEENDAWPRGALHMRFSDNHDERRAIARFGERATLAASTIMFTLDGVPMLYNGMEVGDTTESGAPALFERLPVFWAIAERRPEFRKFYTNLIAMRKAHEALRRGDMEWLRNSDETRVVSYLRRSGVEEMLVVINLSNRPFFGSVEAENGEKFTDITPPLDLPIPPDVPGAERPPSVRPVGLPAVALDSWGFRVFRRAASPIRP